MLATPPAHGGDGVLQLARGAADEALAGLPRWASLVGPAVKNIGIALRAVAVRNAFAYETTLNGDVALDSRTGVHRTGG